MLLRIINDQHVRLELDHEDRLAVDGAPFGPLQMLAASLALCTASVMEDYATTAQFHLHNLAISIQWDYVEQPYRVGEMQMKLEVGPEVPPSRQKALLRVAEHQCTVHNTLTNATQIHTTMELTSAEQA